MTDKTIPFSYETESSIIGAILIENSLIERMEFLTTEHFHSPTHQKIFTTLRRKFDAGDNATPFTILREFESDPDFERVGGALKYFHACVAAASTFPVDSAHVLRELALRRKLTSAFESAVEGLRLGKIAPADICSSIGEMCESVSLGAREWETRNGEVVTQSIIDCMNTVMMPHKTGITRLDKAMDGGLFPGKLYGFAGRKKHGKTILGGTLSCNLAVNGVRHLFICGEMSPEEVHQRNLARMGGFYPSAFRTGYSNSDDFKSRFKTSLEWEQKNILYRNAPGLTFDQLRQIIRRAIGQHRIKGFVLDYLQLVGGKEAKKSGAEHQDEVAQWLADTCRKYHIFGIVLAQINQEGNTRGGEGLRLACDQVYAINRPDITTPPMWLEMMDTRYTPWANIGSATEPGMTLVETGPWFKEL